MFGSFRDAAALCPIISGTSNFPPWGAGKVGLENQLRRVDDHRTTLCGVGRFLQPSPYLILAHNGCL